MEQTTVQVPHETMRYVESTTKKAQAVSNDILQGYFQYDDVAENKVRILYEYERYQTHMGILNDYIGELSRTISSIKQ